MVRAVYEGVAFSHKHSIEKLRNHIDNISVVRMSGGARRSKVWMQIFAYILGIR